MDNQNTNDNQHHFGAASPTENYHTPNKFSNISEQPLKPKNSKKLLLILFSSIAIVGTIALIIVIIVAMNSGNDGNQYSAETDNYNKSIYNEINNARKDTPLLQLYSTLGNESTLGAMKDYAANIPGAQLVVYSDGTGKIKNQDDDEFISFYYGVLKDDSETEDVVVAEGYEPDDLSEETEEEPECDDESVAYEGSVIVENYDLSTPVYGIAYIRAVNSIEDDNLGIVYSPEENKYYVSDLISDPVEFNTKQEAIDNYLSPSS
ncbi:hypothetical protein IKE99_00935 [Candidatus Saccharibacteria bacterium]|nr:hypothetical protein [Candidatus Saccharibacteria bacterium]